MNNKFSQIIGRLFNKHNVDVSIIVPVYNVEEYLTECLDSLENQNLKKVQVIMIDDGSTDRSGEIGEEYAKTHKRFEYHRIENQGLGHARNYAMQFVKGKYFTFIDSDDIIAPDAYQNMFEAAEKEGAQFAICNVARFNSKKTWISALHERVFKQLGTTAQITKDPELINDTISCNKLILKSFWDKHNFKFPENILYEDIPVTIPMHFLADKVAVVHKVGYFWRLRDGVSASITQNTNNIKNFYDRMKVLRMVDEFFKSNITDPELIKVKNLKVLEIDLLIFINTCNSISEEQAHEILREVRDYINENIDEETFNELTVIHKQKYRFVLDNDLKGLIKLLDSQSNDYYNAPVEEKDGKFYIECSEDIFPIKDREITTELKKIVPLKQISDIVVKKSAFDVFAQLYIPRVNISDPSQQEIEVYLQNQKTEFITPLKNTPFENRELTSTKGFVFNEETGKSHQYNYDGTGFIISLDLEEIEINDSNAGANLVVIKYRNRVSKGNLFLSGAPLKIANKIRNNTVIKDDCLLRLDMTMFNELIVNLVKETHFVEKTAVKNKKIQFLLNAAAKAVFAEDGNGNTIGFKTTDNKLFTCPASEFSTDKEYKFFVTKENGNTDLLTRRTKSVNINDTGSNVAVIRSNKDFRTVAYFMPSCTKISDISREAEKIFISTERLGANSNLANVKYADIVVDDEIDKKTVSLANSQCKEENGKKVCSFTVDFGDKDTTKNLYNGYKYVSVEYTLENGDIIREPLCAQKYFKHSIEYGTLAADFYRADGCFVKLRTAYLWPEAENTVHKRMSVINEKYPEYKNLPINPKQIIFESMWGNKFSCNPKHLYEFIDKNYPEYECIWSLEDPRTPISGNGKRVKRGSLEYFRYLATSKYFVNNVNFEDAYEKRDGQIEIQTMHGTPLKTLGLDAKDNHFTKAQEENYIKKNSRWNYLIVQGDFMAEKASACYGCKPELLKTGYPRTDTLFKNNTVEKNRALKENLGLPLDKKVILYVPTWRVKNKFDMKLDIEKMKEALSDDYILLIRIHHLCADGYTVPADGKFVFDFNEYHSVEDLYLLCDILITDYSSVMFDYGVLKKPMVFFTYDIKEYAENLRGMYFDIEKEAPGPLVYTSDELISVISNIDEELEKCKGRIEAFNNKYVNFEGPDSCEKIFETVFDPNNDLK